MRAAAGCSWSRLLAYAAAVPAESGEASACGNPLELMTASWQDFSLMAQAIQVGSTLSALTQHALCQLHVDRPPFSALHLIIHVSSATVRQLTSCAWRAGECCCPTDITSGVLQSVLVNVQAANMTAVFNNSQLNATVFAPNDAAITRVTAANNITIGDLYNNPLDVLTLVSRMLLRMLP